MLTVSGLKDFYFLPHFHDMRCGYAKGYRFMKIRVEEDKSVYRVDWKDIHREQLEQSGESQSLLPISCDDMSDSEKTSFIQFLVAESHKKDNQSHSLQQTIDALGERLSTMQLTLDEIQRSQHATCDENLKLHAQLSRQGVHLKSMQFELKKSLRESAKYRALYEVLRDEKFVGTSQKSGKSRPEAGRDDGKGDWDGPK